VNPGERPGIQGHVVLLIGDCASACETFAMATMQRQPAVIRLGENTEGVFSDVLDRRLPNGWHFGLSNEVYRTGDGRISKLRACHQTFPYPSLAAPISRAAATLPSSARLKF